ncbi:hypothetical protein [Mesorhizobium sp. BR-1-1-10]|uniref:hypothetical protein n=1 Tax=Mesorhizobium sp. BR-1-1-10 TaxID=2876660 RepID=UPI001CD173A8|nr:hypothetical protein [Mesorhizobium sp. BR-1-1-10]MBZ9978168.1 hypothetical protein [Mesorhizobium sp. BR-1-1-10]
MLELSWQVRQPAAEIVFAAAVDKMVAYTYFAKVAYTTNSKNSLAGGYLSTGAEDSEHKERDNEQE